MIDKKIILLLTLSAMLFNTVIPVKAESDITYLAVKAGDNTIAWSSYNTATNTQSEWYYLSSGTTPSSPAHYAYEGYIYFCVRSNDGGLWWTKDSLDHDISIEWNSLEGNTNLPPRIYMSGEAIMHLYVTGLSGGIFYCQVDTINLTQSDWIPLTGSSDQLISLSGYASTTVIQNNVMLPSGNGNLPIIILSFLIVIVGAIVIVYTRG